MKNIYQRVCRQCGSSFRGGPRAWYCENCRADRIRDANRRFRQKGRKADRPIGSIDQCINCGNDYIVNSARQKLCCDCAPEHIKAIDRKQGIQYYHDNKDIINPIRKIKRRTMKNCPICGDEFWAVGGKLACCQEHKKLFIKQRNKKHP